MVALLIEGKDSNSDLVDMIWSLVEQENQQNGSHGRLDNCMIIIGKSDKPFQRARKGRSFGF